MVVVFVFDNGGGCWDASAEGCCWSAFGAGFWISGREDGDEDMLMRDWEMNLKERLFGMTI